MTYPEAVSLDFWAHAGSAARVKTKRTMSLLFLFAFYVRVIKIHVLPINSQEKKRDY